ncbi:MAG: cytochrome c [Campylobacteraceae bacterium]|jgi:hypothetical protein|nr:cytochrome c [Campylobacteraceae bacterium]MBT3882907.1 cytochrome c [Campylobacteraceae bacterium]MBT4031076.1 cytochrome c [Campylobacteraceae bacterium]MBT4179726.1 cytochrome c [Campylobacteraceae bacterium]MBT4572855.1 cytochrome c [Campylobacteraceae bacterium]
MSTLIISSFSNLVENNTNSFITDVEYGKMLYFNPRGIGCNLCHGDTGKGKFITSYKHKAKNDKELKTITIASSDITNIDFKQFSKSINITKSKSIMPKYFLTTEEIESIYIFLKTQRSK